MAFLFKSKKHQDRALGSRDGSGSSMGGATARVRDEKGTRSTPTGSLNSLDIDGSVGSPDQNYGRTRGQSLDQPQQAPPMQPQPQQQQTSDLPLRSGPPVTQPASNPNASLYPWSQRRLTYTSSHPSPFPRYGAAVNSVSSKEGDIYVMGGLINSSTVKGDLWMIEAGGNMACYPLATTAEGPGPRVGHSSLLVGNAFIVFGGDTKIEETDILDETLYLLNTSTRQWSRALPAGPRPSGRYGHSLNILGSKIFIFGGQVEGYFMNDLSAFDLNQLQMPNNRWEMLIPTSDSGGPQGKVPPARTNHSVVTFNDKLYLFGGTNGYQWFNDVWAYDPALNAWSQLDCIGYIPSPREGHAAAIVDDVMYIFGGRTEEGADLGDLAAFRISSRRWYTFQNMGPSPSPRSGHSMTAVGKTIVVVGGEPSSAQAATNDLALVYCLDTTKIRYPNDAAAGQNPARVQARRPSDVTAQNVRGNTAPRDGSMGPDGRRQIAGGAPGPNGYRSPTGAETSPTNGSMNGSSKPPRSTGPGGSSGPGGPSGPPPQGQPPKPEPQTGVSHSRNTSVDRPNQSPQTSAPPVARNASLDRSNQSQPPPGTSALPQQVASLKESEGQGGSGRRTPTQNQNPPRSSSRQADVQAVDSTRSKAQRPARNQGSVDSPVEQGPRQAPARPASPPPPTRQPSNPLSRRSSTRNSQTVALLKELDAARNRNAWYASELELARKAGYVPNASMSPILDSRVAETFDDEDKPLIEALLAMRNELANVQASVDKQAVLAAKQIAEAEKQRDAAIQEAIYAKAKLAARGGSARSTPQLDDKEASDRISEMSRKLAHALNSQKDLQDQVDRLSSELSSEKTARKLADDTANAAQKRMTDLENYKQQNASEVERLKAELHMAQREAREQSVAAAEAIAASQMMRVEKEELEQSYNEAVGSSKGNASTFETLRGALAASAETKTLLERKLDEERVLREKIETKLNKLKIEHEARTAELVAATQRLRDAEELAEQHANEAKLHRQAVLSGLDKMSTKDVAKSDKADHDRVVALQGQLASANALVRKYQQEADSLADKLRGAEERIAGLEAYQEQASREGVSIRRQLQGALRETQSLQAANSDLKQQLAKQQLETNAVVVQHNTLKDILAERGISPTTASRSRTSPRGSPREGSPEQQRVRELEQQLTAAQTALDETKSQAAEKLSQLENDYLSTVHYVKGTEMMLKQFNEQVNRYKTENVRLREQVEELEIKLESQGLNSKGVPADWQSQQENLHAEIDKLQAELNTTSAKLEMQVQAIRQELVQVQRERDTAVKTSDEVNRRLESHKKDLEQLQQENSLLERRAQDAEHKVSTLLDQVELSVDNYRRRSRQAPSLNSETVSTAGPVNGGGSTNGNGNGNGNLNLNITGGGLGHSRQESGGSESLYGDSRMGDARNSTALDNLANELETLRSHWEATNKNYRLSNTFDFDANPVVTKKNESVSIGLSESLADWRKRLDESNPDAPGGAK
ncbi:putative Tip elongation aberrant protein 1 [Podospora fimiseda]|uniref:Tip elongation aberrant protein 1 n=1 Tax=Podospora fimiseda TaxID=252190 RepID=A0AAN7BTY7_9PEZI|nr:putative Tip elongation aberrant protein 1 [Podospora fimiseda]